MAAASGAGMQEAWDFSALEDRDGLRFSWNEWPSSRNEAAANVVPLGALYTPLRPVDGMPPALKYEPVKCFNQKCQAVLNPHCRVDYQHKIWACPFCGTHNHFPQHYAQHISETNLPAELISDYTTVEYEIPGKAFGAPTFLFVIDTCVCEDDELDEIKDSIQQAMGSLIPEDANVGLITFGQHVQIYDISSDVMARSVVLRGDKQYEPSQIQELLGVLRAGAAAGAAPTQSGPTNNARRFLGRAGDSEAAMEAALDDVFPDPWPTEQDCRPNRCLGNAIHVAVSLLEGGLHQSAGRVMLFLSGPTTIGPGKIVEPDLRYTLRSHTDLAKDNDSAKYHDSSREFFDGIAQRCTSSSLQIDVFACALDQVGLFEMRECIENTGGLCVVGDEFKQSIFKESFRRVFTKHEDDEAPEGDAGFMMAGGGAMLEVQTSPDYKVCGAIGHCVSLKKTGPSVSETEIGEGGTYVWALSGVHPTTTIALYFEVNRQEAAPISPDRQRYIQLVTRYQHASGSYRMRVTTACGAWCSSPDMKHSLVAGFDQEAAAVLLARIALLRTAEEDTDDILRWLDVSLIKLCSNFAQYKPDETVGFQLPDTMSIFPQFMFHFRRSVFMQTFNSSPDDSAYKKLTFMREDTANSLVMIQASLLCYSFAGPPSPVLLDAESVRPDVALLLDTFFTVVIWHGATIAQWRKEGYQERPEHAAFKALLQAPQEDAQQIMADRIPVPRYIVCDEAQSQERFLLAKVNPSKPKATHDGVATKEVITDDVSFSVFMEHLIKLAVTAS